MCLCVYVCACTSGRIITRRYVGTVCRGLQIHGCMEEGDPFNGVEINTSL